MSKKQVPSLGGQPGRVDKSVRIAVPVENVMQQRPLWRLHIMDFEGPFAWNDGCADALRNIQQRLASLETMTWADIFRTGSHPIPKRDLCKTAQDRLRAIQQDDVDELFSVRVTGRERLWGIREGQVLKILWWDPEHAVCPSHKKHT